MSWRLKKIRRVVRHEFQAWRNRRCLTSEVRSEDHFVVSYPKSGTHWLGYFFANLITDRIDDGPESLNLSNWQEVTPILGLLSRDVRRIREFRSRPNPRVFLVHSEQDWALPRVTLLVRDPRAILVSYFHHHVRTVPGFHGDLRRFAVEMLRGKLWPSDWYGMNAGWLDRTPPDRLRVQRYEDLHADPMTQFASAAKYAGFDVAEDRVREAVEASSFDRMRDKERAHGIDDGSKGDASVSFMRKGRTDSWKEELPEEVSSLVCFAFGDLMTRLGYLPGESIGGDGGSA